MQQDLLIKELEWFFVVMKIQWGIWPDGTPHDQKQSSWPQDSGSGMFKNNPGGCPIVRPVSLPVNQDKIAREEIIS